MLAFDDFPAGHWSHLRLPLVRSLAGPGGADSISVRFRTALALFGVPSPIAPDAVMLEAG